MEPAKRPLEPAATSANRRPPGGETLLRILCPTDKTGGVIGMSGSIISRIRTEIRFKIRIVDPQPGSDDRVIVISRDSSSSNAQMALVRVFERIVEGAESASSLAGCRLLVGGSEVGCVLGKGGTVVERMRVESGATTIRVLGKDSVPACSEDGDEMIHITGSLSAVRKTLLSVSSCLQNNLRTEQANFSTTKPFGPASRGSGLPALVDPYAQRSYLPSLHAPDYHSSAYFSNSGMDICLVFMPQVIIPGPICQIQEWIPRQLLIELFLRRMYVPNVML